MNIHFFSILIWCLPYFAFLLPKFKNKANWVNFTRKLDQINLIDSY